jgi:hypothetical protein
VTPDRVTVPGTPYALDFQPLRSSLSDAPPMLWGFQVHVLEGERLVGVKTCFVGRVGVQARKPEALEGTVEDLVPTLHELAMEKIRPRLEAGEAGDEILFA